MQKSLPRGKGRHHTFFTPAPRIAEEPETPAVRQQIGETKTKFIETIKMTQTVFSSSCFPWSLLAPSSSLIFGVIVGGMIIWSFQRIAWVAFDAPRIGMHVCSDPGPCHTVLLPLLEAALPWYTSSPLADSGMVDSKKQRSPRYTSGQRHTLSFQSQHLPQSFSTCRLALPFGAELSSASALALAICALTEGEKTTEVAELYKNKRGYRGDRHHRCLHGVLIGVCVLILWTRA